MDKFIARYLIPIDGIAGLTAGVVALLLADRLVNLYGVPSWLILFNGLANIVYGTFSSTLASSSRRPTYLIATLSIANIFWAVACFIVAMCIASSATVFGICLALFEGLFVGTLGVLEWYYRQRLALPRYDAGSKKIDG